MALAASMQHQVEAGDGSELVGRQGAVPAQIRQWLTPGLFVQVDERFRIQKHAAAGTVMPGIAVAERADPAYIVERCANSRQFPVDHGLEPAIVGTEQVRGLKIAMKDAHWRPLGQSLQQALAHFGRPGQPFRIRSPFDQTVPASHILLEWNRIPQVRRLAPVHPVNARERSHDLTSKVMQCLGTKRSAPLALAKPQYIAFQLRHHEIGTLEPFQLVASTATPLHAAVRDVGIVQRVQHLYLAQHIRGPLPAHVGWGQPQEPGFLPTATEHTEAVREPCMARHLVHVGHAGRVISVLGLHERPQPLFQLVEFHSPLLRPVPVTFVHWRDANPVDLGAAITGSGSVLPGTGILQPHMPEHEEGCSILPRQHGRRAEMIRTLDAAAVRPETPVSSLRFETTTDLVPLDDGIGQERASRALQFGLEMRAHGFNLFVLGEPTTERGHLVNAMVEHAAGKQGPPAEWCYLHDFQQPDRPRCVRLPAGEGQRLAADSKQLIEEMRSVLPALFREEAFQRRVHEIQAGFEKQQKQALKELQQEAEAAGLTLLQTPQGFAFAPVRDGEVMDNEAFQELPEDERQRLTEAMDAMTQKLVERMQDLPARHQALVREQKAVAREFVENAVERMIAPLRQRWQTWPEIMAWLRGLAEDIQASTDTLLALENDQQPQQMPFRSPEHFYNRYRVNLLIDHRDSRNAPICYESHPTLENLLGRLEYRSEFGSLSTDLTLIRPGALHRANGGYLILEVERLLSKPFAWDALKRALFDRCIRIESGADYLSMGHSRSLDPDPVPLQVKVILLGSRLLYYLLSAHDPDFQRLFKVPADLADRVERSDDNVQRYARLLGTIARNESLLPLAPDGVARIIDHSARLVGDAGKLTAHTERIADLVREADHMARQFDAHAIGAAHVQQAIEAHVERLDRIRTDMHERITRGTVVVATQGTRVAQVNGLSVLQIGDFAFGQPSRISATARLGRGEIVDIERESRLGGNLHSKAVMILGAFLGQRYASNSILSLHATLAFEQSYGGVDGDSATVAEVCALLSALAELPLRQDIAVTGSMDQYGRVQAVGGTNEKIEGFFDICSARGLQGSQGVLMPADNARHLMLRPDVVTAIDQGQFWIWTMETVDDALELLTGLPAGNRDERDAWTEGSVNARVQTRIDELSRLTRNLQAGSNGPAQRAAPPTPSIPTDPLPPGPEDNP